MRTHGISLIFLGGGIFPDLFFSSFLGLLKAPTRNIPERVRDTTRAFPEKSGKPPGLENPPDDLLSRSATEMLQIARFEAQIARF